MHTKSVSVPNISCGHCIRTIETELSALDNIISAKANEETKIVDITWNDPQTWENINSLLNEINYPAVDE
jgi:copper chaperone CopZ